MRRERIEREQELWELRRGLARGVPYVPVEMLSARAIWLLEQLTRRGFRIWREGQNGRQLCIQGQTRTASAALMRTAFGRRIELYREELVDVLRFWEGQEPPPRELWS